VPATQSGLSSAKLSIKEAALSLGFNDIRFIAAKPLLESEEKFLAWRKQNLAADMNYLLRPDPINARPNKLLQEAKTLIILTANYFTSCPPKPGADYGRIANYAVGKDYHKVLRKKISELIDHPELSEIFNNSRFFTDAVPLLEKSFAKKAGLGFKGKNTLLISKDKGSYNFILEIITDIEFEPDGELSFPGTCGNCIRCIDICPTNALIGAHQIDAGLCISYLTIENRGEIKDTLKPKIGDWLFGCDLCQEVCPYNKKISTRKETPFLEFHPDSGVGHWLYLPELLSLDNCCDTNISNESFDKEFYKRFGGTALTRPKRKGLIRNALIVAANSKSYNSEKLLARYLKHKDPVLSDTAKWALKTFL
jgi:epoxyqueuosine reductase